MSQANLTPFFGGTIISITHDVDGYRVTLPGGFSVYFRTPQEAERFVSALKAVKDERSACDLDPAIVSRIIINSLMSIHRKETGAVLLVAMFFAGGLEGVSARRIARAMLDRTAAHQAAPELPPAIAIVLDDTLDLVQSATIVIDEEAGDVDELARAMADVDRLGG